MIVRINQSFTLTAAEQQVLNALKPFQPGAWDKGEVAEIKRNIHDQMMVIQSEKCCYCGLRVNETGRGELDHIAKKGGPKRPAYIEYAFSEYNLAIACQYCNSSSKKGQEDVLDHIDRVVYSNCTFKIVHPFFDDPSHHYDWKNGTLKVLISARSPKGKYSVGLFELDSEAHTLARAKQIMFEKKLRRHQGRQLIIQRVKKILSFR